MKPFLISIVPLLALFETGKYDLYYKVYLQFLFLINDKIYSKVLAIDCYFGKDEFVASKTCEPHVTKCEYRISTSCK